MIFHGGEGYPDKRFVSKPKADPSLLSVCVVMQRRLVARGVGCAGLDCAREVIEDGAGDDGCDQDERDAAQFVNAAGGEIISFESGNAEAGAFGHGVFLP
jgi:hypothetical protein